MEAEICTELRHEPGVYLLCFSGKVANHAMHYIGASQDVAWRVKKHRAGNGGRLPQIAIQRGLTLHVTRVWYMPMGEAWLAEKRIKSWRNHKYLCPKCNPQAYKWGNNLLVNSEQERG